MKAVICFIIISLAFIGCSANVNLRELEISTDLVDFGIVNVNKSAFKTVEVYNNTQKTLEIFYEFQNSDENDFELIADAESEIVLPSKSLNIEIKLRSSTMGDKNAKLILIYDHLGSPTHIDIKAQCIKHDIELYPYSDKIQFNNARVNASSLKLITVKNIGNADVNIESITFEKTTCFTILPNVFPLTIQEGDMIIMNLYFKPTETGITNDLMKIKLDSSSVPYEISLIGNGVLPYIYDIMPKQRFDYGVLPSNWSVEGINNCWEIGKPENGNGLNAYSGQYCAGTSIDGNYPDNSDTRLVSPEVDLSRSIAPVLCFNQWINTIYDQNGDGGFVEIRTKEAGATNQWSEWKVLHDTVPIYNIPFFNDELHCAFGGLAENYVWEQVSVDLYEYHGEIVQIAWHFQSDGTQNTDGWYIDDIYIFEIKINVG